MFIKGQRVVCVNDRFTPALARMFAKLPTKNQEYTVREVYLGQEAPGAEGATCGILLVELLNPVDGRKRELGFNAERFAPLDNGEEETAEDYVEIHQGDLIEV